MKKCVEDDMDRLVKYLRGQGVDARFDGECLYIIAWGCMEYTICPEYGQVIEVSSKEVRK